MTVSTQLSTGVIQDETGKYRLNLGSMHGQLIQVLILQLYTILSGLVLTLYWCIESLTFTSWMLQYNLHYDLYQGNGLVPYIISKEGSDQPSWQGLIKKKMFLNLNPSESYLITMSNLEPCAMDGSMKFWSALYKCSYWCTSLHCGNFLWIFTICLD